MKALLGLRGLDNQLAGLPMMSTMNPEKSTISDDQRVEIKGHLSVVYSNMAACHLKNKNYRRAIENATAALAQDPNNIKAKFRRAQAKLADGNLAGAEADLISLGDSVPGVKAEKEKIKKLTKEADEKQRKTMGGFLNRGRIIDDEERQNEAAQASQSEYEPSTWSGTAPKIQELAEGEV
ncbi:hypothetical protein BGW38_004003 [Lunasporangiospora selenospora]|uniref:Tetratricopeptide repeat-containing protein n=1 Tax=Lunasporangiospora selenospora TaxID=979761 RepID=A0A9P6G3V1_9FUNG|nr:hypothetical protein BGW38_004003 [Lunasporangiospora selenospora]